MNKFKKIIAVVLMACTALSFTGCSDTTWAYQYGDNEISSGLYIMHTMTAYTMAQSHQDRNPDVEDIFKQKLDGVATKDWIVIEAKKQSAKYASIESKFDELGLTLSQTDINVIENEFTDGWKTVGPFFDKNSVGEQSYKLTIINNKKRELVFKKYYGEGGIEEVKNEDLIAHFEENFASINIMGIELDQGDDLTEEQNDKNDKAKESAERMLKELNEGKKTFNEVNSDYIKLENEGKDEEDLKDEEIKDDDETKMLIQKGSTQPSADIVTAVFSEAEVDGDAIMVTDPLGYFLVQRYDVTEDETKFDEMRDTLLYDIKGEEFEALINKWGGEMESKLVANESSIKRYNPKNIDFSM